MRTISKTEFTELLDSMLVRPKMYAQNPASLEDQFTLLLRLADNDSVLFNEYLHFTRKSGCGSCTLVSKYRSFEELAEKLKEFKKQYMHD